MEIKNIKRPWIQQAKQGTRYNRDTFYQTKEWKSTRTSFLMSEPWQQLPPIHGIKYQNIYCFECWKKGKIVDTFIVDHIQRKRAGGDWTDFSNLQGLCNPHHNAKSAREKNEANAPRETL